MSTKPRTSALRMPSTHPTIRNANHEDGNTLGSCPQMALSSMKDIQHKLQFIMKQSGHLNPSDETGTGCPVTSKYGKTLPNKHGGVGRQQQLYSHFFV